MASGKFILDIVCHGRKLNFIHRTPNNKVSEYKRSDYEKPLQAMRSINFWRKS